MDELEIDSQKTKEETAPQTPQQVKAERVKSRLRRNKYKKQCFNGEKQVSDHFEDGDMRMMRLPYTEVSLLTTGIL